VTGDDQDVAGLGSRAPAVAEHVAALDLVHVQDRGGHPQRGTIAEPEVGADARADLEVGVRRAQRPQLAGRQVTDPEAPGLQLGGDHVVDQTQDLGQVGAARQRQVQRHALDGGEETGGRAELLGGHAVSAHARESFEHDACGGILLEQREQVGEPADGVYHPPCREVVGQGRAGRAPGRQHQQVAVEPLHDLGQLVVGADGHGVHAEPVGPAGEPAQPETVPVALGDRHEPGRLVDDRAEVAAPAFAVDGESEAHRLRPGIRERRLRYSAKPW
jgi:hypothetical protein